MLNQSKEYKQKKDVFLVQKYGENNYWQQQRLSLL